MTKELLEAGVLTIVTHSCLTCLQQLCLLCALEHVSQNPQHQLKQIVSKQVLQSLSKKGAAFDQLLSQITTERMRAAIHQESTKHL